MIMKLCIRNILISFNGKIVICLTQPFLIETSHFIHFPILSLVSKHNTKISVDSFASKNERLIPSALFFIHIEMNID